MPIYQLMAQNNDHPKYCINTSFEAVKVLPKTLNRRSILALNLF